MSLNSRFLSNILLLILLGCFMPIAVAQDSDDSIFSFAGDTAVVSKYIWRGQRLTDDWSHQTGGTVGIGGFSFNVWGNMDLTAVNEGDALKLVNNYSDGGLKGRFTEVDYTFSYSHSLEGSPFALDTGAIIYTFPGREASLATTTEIYGSVSADSFGSPSATIYIDVDESGRGSGTNGIYFLLAAGHSIESSHPNFTGVDFSASVSMVNGGFGNFYYGADKSGAHDINIGFSVPITINDNWSAGFFVSHSRLLGTFESYQFVDPRLTYKGTAGTPASYAGTTVGGFTLSLGF